MFICPRSTTIYPEPVADQFISSHMKLCFSYHPVSWRFINIYQIHRIVRAESRRDV
ncbi:hypothetical protein CIT292_06049 [Citrobacter youngae ATCC 29220]|uniref:Uncharacterized protein n=1 Tax=Citrobacter youngae ATCC 29220 TaxID=500640 RepID=D4B6W0_9ENTR|nr:hypothetical protein CIT292_06049 [Citrobacter youngae ATCC 29220]